MVTRPVSPGVGAGVGLGGKTFLHALVKKFAGFGFGVGLGEAEGFGVGVGVGWPSGVRTACVDSPPSTLTVAT
jgi:hypothetical protein